MIDESILEQYLEGDVDYEGERGHLEDCYASIDPEEDVDCRCFTNED